MLREPTFECFFSSITDYFRARNCISFEFPCVIKEDFILMDFIKCNDNLIEVKEGKVYFCFCFSISSIFSEVRTLEDAEKFAQGIQKLEFFTDTTRNNYICNRKHLKAERGKYDWIKGAKYFFNSTTLVKYAHKHGLFNLDSLPKDLKERVIGSLNISDEAIRELKWHVVKYDDVDSEYVTRYKDD